MSEKDKMNVDDLVSFLDKQMGSGGFGVKPKFEDGKMVETELKIFSDGLGEICPSCSSIPNLMGFAPDNMTDEEREMFENGMQEMFENGMFGLEEE